MTGVFFFNVIFACLFLLIVTLYVLLVKGLHKSLYLYRNVAFIAGILFAFCLMISLYNYLIECLLETKQLTLRYIFIEFVDFPKTFSIFALPFFGIICILLCISNISLIRHEGLRRNNLLGAFLSALILGGTALINYGALFVEENLIKPAGLLDNVPFVTFHTYFNLFLLLMICYFECFFLGTVVMGYLAARQKPKYDKDYIIILGCSIDKNGGLYPLLKARTNRAVKYAWEQEVASGRPVKYVPSGGQGSNEVMSEGSAMELYLLAHGAEKNEVFPEKESRNTYENFLFSGRIIHEIDPDAGICFATTNYHMFRSGMLARKAGLDAEGIASKAKWYFWPNGFVREFFGIVAMRKKEHLLVTGMLFAACVILAIISVAFRVR